jgi:hypothetical protein
MGNKHNNIDATKNISIDRAAIKDGSLAKYGYNVPPKKKPDRASDPEREGGDQ